MTSLPHTADILSHASLSGAILSDPVPLVKQQAPLSAREPASMPTSMQVPGQRFLAVPVPRYTSYPPATAFHDRLPHSQLLEWLAQVPEDQGISLYIHVPFCDRLCWFCGCHTKQTKRYEPIRRYLEQLKREMALVAQYLGRKQPVSHLHLGGGSPSMLAPDDMRGLRRWLDQHFRLDASTEISVELDPNDINEASYPALMDLGLTRASLGVQDFDPDVQRLINRPQSFEETQAVILRLRDLGVDSLNIDALYGLPSQDNQRLARTLEQVLSLNPDRIAMFGYAHVPWFKKHQRLIPTELLPGARQRLDQARLAADMFAQAGYQAIGFDHYAKPHDSLAKAARNKTLARNFQGYTTDTAQVLIGMGPSSISYFPQGYAQNTSDMARYTAALDAEHVPLARGYALTADDRMRGYAISQLACYFALDFDDLTRRFGHQATAVIDEVRATARYELQDICQLDAQGVRVRQADPFAVRLLASRIDQYYDHRIQRGSAAI